MSKGAGAGGRGKGERLDTLAALQAANEELRAKLTNIQIELQQEKNKVRTRSSVRAGLGPLWFWLSSGQPSGEGEESGSEGRAPPCHSCHHWAEEQTPWGKAEGAQRQQRGVTTATRDGADESHQDQRWRNSASQWTSSDAERGVNRQGDHTPVHPSVCLSVSPSRVACLHVFPSVWVSSDVSDHVLCVVCEGVVCYSTGLTLSVPACVFTGIGVCLLGRLYVKLCWNGGFPCRAGPGLHWSKVSGLGILNCYVVQGRNTLMTEVEEVRRSWELEKCRLQQELQEMRAAKRIAEEAAASAQQACQARAAELRSAHHQHHEELNRIRRDCEREVRRLVGALNHLVFQLLHMHVNISLIWCLLHIIPESRFSCRIRTTNSTLLSCRCYIAGHKNSCLKNHLGVKITQHLCIKDMYIW